MPPAISVVMSVYNGDAYLAQAISSVLDQTYSDFEFLIINDGSNDSSAAIIRQFAATDSRILLLENDKNQGLAASLNRGIERAEGRYIARMDADDICMPERFQMQIDFLETHPAVGVLGSRMQVISAEQTPLFEFDVPLQHSLIVWALFFGRTFAHPSVMIRSDLIRSVGAYDATVPAAQDLDLWSRLVGYTRFANLPDKLINYRSHAGATSIQKTSLQRQTLIHTLHQLLERLLEWDVAPEIVEPIVMLRQNRIADFTLEQREMLITMMHDLYTVLLRKEWVLSEEADLLRQTMNEQIEQVRSVPATKAKRRPYRYWLHQLRNRLK